MKAEVETTAGVIDEVCDLARTQAETRHEQTSNLEEQLLLDAREPAHHRDAMRRVESRDLFEREPIEVALPEQQSILARQSCEGIGEGTPELLAVLRLDVPHLEVVVVRE